jgi:hypothetical protein
LSSAYAVGNVRLPESIIFEKKSHRKTCIFFKNNENRKDILLLFLLTYQSTVVNQEKTTIDHDALLPSTS